MNKKFKVVTIGEQTYIFNRRVFQVAFIVIFLLFAGLLLNYGFKTNFYYHCPEKAIGGVCQNIFWINCSRNAFYSCADPEKVPAKYSYLLDREFIRAGDVYGQSPGFLVNYFGAIFGLVLSFAFFINHLVYNKGFSFKQRIRGVN